MDFVRKIIDSNDIESVVSLPNELKNKKVELLIFPAEETEKKKNFNPEKFKGIMHLNKEEVEKELEDMRREWERL